MGTVNGSIGCCSHHHLIAYLIPRHRAEKTGIRQLESVLARGPAENPHSAAARDMAPSSRLALAVNLRTKVNYATIGVGIFTKDNLYIVLICS
jgi:hypothetical protein